MDLLTLRRSKKGPAYTGLSQDKGLMEGFWLICSVFFLFFFLRGGLGFSRVSILLKLDVQIFFVLEGVLVFVGFSCS